MPWRADGRTPAHARVHSASACAREELYPLYFHHHFFGFPVRTVGCRRHG
jgi:hypothetical protein